MNAVKKVLQNSHFDQGVQNVATPSLSLKTGHSLKKCINIPGAMPSEERIRAWKMWTNLKNLLPQSGVTMFRIIPFVLSALRN